MTLKLLGKTSTNLYFVKDTDINRVYVLNKTRYELAIKFELASHILHLGRITRRIHNTLYLPQGVIVLHNYIFDTHDDFETVLRELPEDVNTDRHLSNLIRFGEGADFSNQEIFRYVTKIDDQINITAPLNLYGLSAGLGFNGEAASLIFAERDFPYLPNKFIILEIVNSYDEGYSVDRTEITTKLFRACQLKEVKDFFETRKKKEIEGSTNNE